jgi:hypothetical protein
MCARPWNGTRWCSHMEKSSMLRSITYRERDARVDRGQRPVQPNRGGVGADIQPRQSCCAR